MELLERHFDIALETPDGIKKLRELILTLAMKGKLVKQDPNDQPASELLKEIEAEKQKLIKDGKIKKQESLPPINPDELPYTLPNEWAWVKLGNVFTLKSGVSFSKEEELNEGKFIYLKVGDMNLSKNEITITTSSIFVNESKTVLNSLIPENSIIFPKRGGAIATNKKRLVKFPICVDTNIMAIICPSKIDLLYAYNWFKTHDLALLNTGTSVPQINNKEIAPLLLPVPPLAEQKRIVEKIDQLMALCDKLEAERNERDKSKIKIHSTAMTRLLSAPDSTAFNCSWSFITKHFSELYSVTQNVDELKKAILQLAVMGKLVPQDVNDQPASELLVEIENEQRRLISEEGLKTEANNLISLNEEYLGKPKGWTYCRLGNLAKFIDYRGRTPEKLNSGIPLITAKNVRYGFINREPYEFIAEDDYNTWMTRGFPQIGDLLFTTEAPMGNIAVIDIDEKFALAQRVICFQLHKAEMAQYLKWHIMSLPFQSLLLTQATGMTATGIKASKLKELPIPIPPLAEQKRIVEKIDLLMELCNSLEQQIKDSTEKKSETLEAVLSMI